jgi:hypothetical protein
MLYIVLSGFVKFDVYCVKGFVKYVVYCAKWIC